jgi:hypothetical protein
MVKPITIFISYAHEDAAYMEELQKYLTPYVKKQLISVWTDKDIMPGQKWDEMIKSKLKESEMILFLVSQDFLVSDYINNVEIKSAVENNKLIIIPIIIRPIEMSQLELNSFQVVPSGAEPIAKWQNRDDAWVDVIRALKNVFDKINGGDSDHSDNVTTSNNKSNHSAILNKVNATDKIVMLLLLFLIGTSIIVFGYGLFTQSGFHIFASFVGMGIGLIGYFIGRRFLSF